MAKIIYREGFDGRNDLDGIEGIEINYGKRKALIYPKYTRLSMIDNFNMFLEWESEEEGIRQAYESDGIAEDEELYRINSPASLFVSKFITYKYGGRCLPTLGVARGIAQKWGEIDNLARRIKDADLLADYYNEDIMTCQRAANNRYYAVHLKNGYVEELEVFESNLCIPCVLDY